MKIPDDQFLVQAYRHACELDLLAFKPGNVSVFADGHDMTVDDFRRSAAASAPWLADFGLALGDKILYAVQATRDAVGCNTNLGIVLLCAPLIEAVQRMKSQPQTLRESLDAVLKTTTKDDAAKVYQAIRVAQPGGLGESDREDVRDAPAVTLTEAMGFARQRDRIAYQYASGYKDIFDFGVIRYNHALNRWGDEAWAAVAVFVSLLRRIPDSHIERKFGTRFTGKVAAKMALLEEELWESESPERAMERLRETDAEFKSSGINPGTTADLTVATILAFHLENEIQCQ